MVPPESPDPLDPLALRENTENPVLKDLKVFQALSVSLDQREILDLLEKTVNLDLADLQAQGVTMAKTETKEQLDLQDPLASKENEAVPDLRETKVSKAFPDQLVILERQEDPEKLV